MKFVEKRQQFAFYLRLSDWPGLLQMKRCLVSRSVTVRIVCKFARRHFECCLTTELSGRPPPPLHIGEHAIRCEHDAPTIIHGPLQLVVRSHYNHWRVSWVPDANPWRCRRSRFATPLTWTLCRRQKHYAPTFAGGADGTARWIAAREMLRVADCEGT